MENDLTAALNDAFPVSQGHTLVVPKRHAANFLKLEPAEQEATWSLVRIVTDHLDRELGPTGYNIGINVGRAAGQTVDHAHLHIIPRYEGDVDDPRGGVRCVLPAKAKYWGDEQG